MIPVYCMEEHHEAFYYWGLAVENGYLQKEGNTLFHIDHHDDLENGGYFLVRHLQDILLKLKMVLRRNNSSYRSQHRFMHRQS